MHGKRGPPGYGSVASQSDSDSVSHITHIPFPENHACMPGFLYCLLQEPRNSDIHMQRDILARLRNIGENKFTTDTVELLCISVNFQIKHPIKVLN